jgi:AcrR family transcriptional regulator
VLYPDWVTTVGRKRTSRADPELPTRARQKQDTRERVRAAALELFMRDGYEATTTKAIAARAGVASGTVFVHAPDKEDLLFLVMHDELEKVTETQLATLPASAPLLEQLLHLFGGLYRMYGRHPEVARAFIKAFPGARGPNGQRVGALTFSFLHRVAALIRDHQDRGLLVPDVEPLVLAQNVFALYFFALTSWIGGYTTLETALDPHLRMALTVQLRGLVRSPA